MDKRKGLLNTWKTYLQSDSVWAQEHMEGKFQIP